MSSLVHFLLVFDQRRGELREQHELSDPDEAVRAYGAKEREYEGEAGVDVVLIGSDSLETVKVTHANYFGGSVARSKYFAGI